MDDGLLLSRAAAGDLDSFGQLYDSYFHRVYDFSWRLTLDAQAAARVTEALFLEASRTVASAPKGLPFRGWLFGIAARQAIPSASAPVTAQATDEEGFGSFDVPSPSTIDPQLLRLDDGELPVLVWEAASALSAQDRAVLDLHLRQGLDSGQLAGVLGTRPAAAATVVKRLKAAAARAIVAYVVARRSDCPGLRRALGEQSLVPYSDEARRLIEEHLATCRACQRDAADCADPLEILASFAPVQAPLALKGDVWRAVAESWGHGSATRAAGGGFAGAIPATAPAAGGGGLAGLAPVYPGGGSLNFDGPGDRSAAAGGDSWDRKQLLWIAGAAAGLLLFAFAMGAVLVRAFGGGGGGGSGQAVGTTPAAAASATAGASRTAGPGVSISTPTPNLTPSATPSATESPTPAPTDTAVPRVTPTLSIRTVAPQVTPTPVPPKPTDTAKPGQRR